MMSKRLRQVVRSVGRASKRASHKRLTAEQLATLAPPWILVTDYGKPEAICPAGRPGTVAEIRGMPLAVAKQIVAAANQAHVRGNYEAMNDLSKRLERLVAQQAMERIK